MFLEDVLKAWKAPYRPESVRDLKPKKSNRPIARHASVSIHAFMPLHSAIVSPDKFNRLFCKWGDVTKTIWLDDAGRKRDIDEEDLDLLINEAIQTKPKENPHPEKLSALRFPDWVENKTREEKCQEIAINQFYKIEEDAIEAFGDFLEDGEEVEDEEGIIEDDGEFVISDDAARELDRLMEMNVDIEI